MATQRVGIREFRDKLATYVLESDAPLAITRHGDTVGLFIPTRRKRTDAERIDLAETAARWHKILAENGVTEDEVIEDFKRWRATPK